MRLFFNGPTFEQMRTLFRINGFLYRHRFAGLADDYCAYQFDEGID